MKPQLKLSAGYARPNGILEMEFTRKLVSTKFLDALGYAIMGIGMLLFFYVGPFMERDYLFYIAYALLPLGGILAYFFSISENKVIVRLGPAEQVLTITGKNSEKQFRLKGSRFRWSYRIPKEGLPKYIASNDESALSAITLNLELLTNDNKTILLYHTLPFWGEYPKDWQYFFERDHMKVRHYKTDLSYHITGGLKPLKREIDKFTE